MVPYIEPTLEKVRHRNMPKRFDDDDSRSLPYGMKRVGYDASTERYTFRKGDDLWLGEPGSYYGGKLKWGGKAPDARPTYSVNRDKETKRKKDSDNDADDKRGRDKGDNGKDATGSIFLDWEPALPYASSSTLQSDENEWGVPVQSISATGTRPPDGDSPDSLGLKRRASRIKKAASSTGVVRRLTGKRKAAQPMQQEDHEPLVEHTG